MVSVIGYAILAVIGITAMTVVYIFTNLAYDEATCKVEENPSKLRFTYWLIHYLAYNYSFMLCMFGVGAVAIFGPPYLTSYIVPSIWGTTYEPSTWFICFLLTAWLLSSVTMLYVGMYSLIKLYKPN